MPCIFQSFLLSSSNNESVFLPIYKPDIREAIKCHLPHLVSEPLCGTLTIELKNGGGVACLFCLVVYLFLFGLPSVFVSMLFWWCIKKSLALGITCTQGSGILILALPLTCYVTLDT